MADQLLFRDAMRAIGTYSSGRMSLVVALSFLLLGLALLLVSAHGGKRFRPSEILIFIFPAAVLSIVAVPPLAAGDHAQDEE